MYPVSAHPEREGRRDRGQQMEPGVRGQGGRAIIATVALLIVASSWISGQSDYSTGQNIAAAFEGWRRHSDGTYELIFGYFNRNADEMLDVPVGPDNSVEPGGPDQGQPTRFFPSRNRYVFSVTVPQDFGNSEVVWTLTTKGKTERAYATLRPEYAIDTRIMMLDGGSVGRLLGNETENSAPVVTVEGDLQRATRVGEPLSLALFAHDDGIPNRGGRGLQPVIWGGGLRVGWYVYRGAGTVTFEPEQLAVYPDRNLASRAPGWRPPPLSDDGRYDARAMFSAPGMYVLRAIAHDGGLGTTQNVTVTVTD